MGFSLKESVKLKKAEKLKMGKSVLWLACVVVVVAAAGLASGAEEQLVKIGEVEPIDISDPSYQELGERVVEKINDQQTGSHLQFLKLMCGWHSDIGFSSSYKLCLKVIDNDNDNAVVYYEAFANANLHFMSVTGFHPITNLIHCCSSPQAKAIA